jgi:hypothetical protein
MEGKVKTYQETVLDREQRFAMRLGSQWVFGIVRNFEDIGPIVYNRIDSMAAGAITYQLDGGGAADFQALENTNQKDYFWEEDNDYLLHAFIGINPPDLRMWIRYPASLVRGNLSRIKATNFARETIGYIDGNEDGSPFDMPSAKSELMFPKFMDSNFGFYNPLPYIVTPKLKFQMRRYNVQYFNPTSPKQLNIINRMIKSELRAHWWTPGNHLYDYDISSKLNVEPVKINWVDKEVI